jgi:Tfp pilus assembly protein PilF
MSEPNPTDVHAPYVQQLLAASDWAGLIRYWIAHQHEAALEAAIGLVGLRNRVLKDREIAADDPAVGDLWVNRQTRRMKNRWRGLDAFLTAVHQNPFDLHREEALLVERPRSFQAALLPGAYGNLLQEALLVERATLLPLGGNSSRETLPAERATLLLLLLYPRAAQCELAVKAPVEMQDRLLRTGLEASKRACEVARMLKDQAVAASFRLLMARGHYELRHLEAARDSYREALAICRGLASRRPNVYRPLVAKALNNLGAVQHALNDPEAARASYDKALTAYPALALQRPDVYRPDVAMTLNNLGIVQLDLHDLEAARHSFQEALAAYRELAACQPDAYRPDVAMTLNNLGAAQRALNDPEAARASYDEALKVYRALALQRPDVYKLFEARNLFNLGRAQQDLNNLEAACHSFKEALALSRALALQRPDVHQPLVAKALISLGNIPRDLNDLEAARHSLQEALAAGRELAEQWPDVYRPLVAEILHTLGTVQSVFHDLEVAWVSIQDALALQRPDVYRRGLATTLNNLGTVQLDLHNLEAARSRLQEAAKLLDAAARPGPTGLLLERLRCWDNLGRLYLTDSPALGWPDYPAARAAFRRACAYAEQYRGRFLDQRERQRVQGEVLHVYERLVQVCTDIWSASNYLGALQEAVEVAEATGLPRAISCIRFRQRSRGPATRCENFSRS